MRTKTKSKHTPKDDLWCNHLKSMNWLLFQDPKLIKDPAKMVRISFKLPNFLIHCIDLEVEKGEYISRSEFMRDRIRNYFHEKKEGQS